MKNGKLTPLQRLIQQATGDRVALGNGSDPIATSCPNLWEWLSRVDADDDHLKEPATLKISLVPGGFQATLTDPTLGYSVDASGGALLSVYEILERQLTSENPSIRRWLKGEIVLKKKPKKSKTQD